MTCDFKKSKNRILRGIGTILICLGLVCAAALAGIEAFIRPTLEKLLNYKCRMAAERIISDAVFERFGGNEDYGGIVTLTADSDGHIAALSVDRAKVNSLKALMGDAVNEGIERLGEETVGISSGTLTGISLLYGEGAELKFRMEPKGAADTILKCSFDSAGINQTVHSIILEVKAEISPMSPGFSQTVDISYEILLAQTVIVGSVPESFSHIVLDEEHLSEIADIDI